MDFRYARPPPPPPPPSSVPDPHHHQQPPRQPLPPPGPWFSAQFQYHPSQHSPSPPPPQWAPPPPYNHQYSLPPRPQMPPPQPYPPVNQDWSNPSWGHQGWDFPVHKNEDDWAAKARAWAASKAVTDNQQSQFAPVGRPEELNHYPDQYPQNVDPHYSDVQQHSLPASSYQQYTSPAAPSHMTPAGHMQDPSSFSSGYVPDGHYPYTAREGTLVGDTTVAYRHQESTPTSLSVHQQEVPSSYSSVAGRESGEQNGNFYPSSHMPFTSAPQHQMQPPLPHSDRHVSMEQPHYAFSNQSAESTTDISDQPLDFVPRFSRDPDPFGQSKYTNESGGPIRDVATAAAMPSIHAWNSSPAPGVVYSSVPPVHPSGPQVDPSLAVHSPGPAHSASLFGMMSGPSFQPTMPSASASFPIGTANAFHATNAFLGDTFGTPGFPDRPKKASVPNWLREEIIKNKAVVETSAPGISKDDIESNEDEAVDKSDGKGDQVDGKNVESSRSTEEEDDDEDYVEAARTAAINQEIKRVLTEVLLKVTDELFDEIATKILDEDDLVVEGEHSTVVPNHMISPSTPAAPTPKSSAKVLIPPQTKETDLDDVSGKSTSTSHGDVLGLASYASDDDEDEDVQNSAIPSSKSSNPAPKNFSDKGKHLAENGSLQADTGELSKNVQDEEKDPFRLVPNGTTGNHSAVGSELSHNGAGIESVHSSAKTEYVAAEDKCDDSHGEKDLDGYDVSKSKHSVGDNGVGGTELPIKSLNTKKPITDDSQCRTPRDGLDKRDGSESKLNSASKVYIKEVESGKDRAHRKVDENSRSQDERHAKRSKKDDRNGSKEKMKERGVTSREKAKESDSGKRVTNANIKEDRKDTERDRRGHTKEDDRKRERAKDEKGERSRHKLASDSSRHKRRRSSSIGSRSRSSKDNTAVSHGNGSSEGSSDDSRRNVHSKQRNSSPSPVRSRKRQVSRSPHSKHSQRRHSPYSSLETTRERRRQ